jgi:hypothetical protein
LSIGSSGRRTHDVIADAAPLGLRP